MDFAWYATFKVVSILLRISWHKPKESISHGFTFKIVQIKVKKDSKRMWWGRRRWWIEALPENLWEWRAVIFYPRDEGDAYVHIVNAENIAEALWSLERRWGKGVQGDLPGCPIKGPHGRLLPQGENEVSRWNGALGRGGTYSKGEMRVNENISQADRFCFCCKTALHH